MICIVGVGKMGAALAKGFLSSGLDPSALTLVDHKADRHDLLRSKFSGVAIVQFPVPCDAAVVATKPADVTNAAAQASQMGAQRIISIAAGVSLDAISAAAKDVPVARAMPNVGVLVGASTTGVCATDDSTRLWVGELMKRVGTVVFAAEQNFDVVTALGGSGPAFIASVVESLIEAGCARGLDIEQATDLVLGMLRSTIATIDGQSMSPTALREMVSTPGGTTLAGLNALSQNDLESVIRSAVDAAATRSRELSK